MSLEKRKNSSLVVGNVETKENGAPLGEAARVSEELSIECMLAISFQRSDAGYTLANRPAPVETKEKLLLTDGRERWLVVGFALLFFSFPL